MRKHTMAWCFSLCFCLTAWGQAPPDVVAMIGEEKVTREDLAEELAQVTGREILNNLIQEKLVQQEIKRRNITIPPDAVEGRLKAREFQWKKQAQQGNAVDRLEGAPSVEAQRRGIELLLAMETMAKQDFGMHPQQPITNLKVAKWLRSLLDRAKIVGREGGGLPDGVYASVNGEYVTVAQFNELLFLNAKRTEVMLALERIIARKLIEQETEKGRVKVAPSDIDSELVRLEGNIRRDPRNKNMTIAHALRAQGLSPLELRSDPSFRTLVAARKILRNKISPAEAREFCEQHKALYGSGKVRASQIFVAAVDTQTGRPLGPAAQQDALQKITKIHADLVAGADFAELAKKHSDDASTKDKGGDLGFFSRYGVIRDPMAGAAFLLRKGEFSGVIASPLGYHIMKTTDVEEPERVDFEKVSDKVINDMIDIRYPDFMTKLRDGGSVKILYK